MYSQTFELRRVRGKPWSMSILQDSGSIGPGFKSRRGRCLSHDLHIPQHCSITGIEPIERDECKLKKNVHRNRCKIYQCELNQRKRKLALLHR